jgi:glycosyltransferase involved in cell wall biosynthesis
MGWRPFTRKSHSYPQSYPHNSQFIPGLSVIIITRNEERDIEACLETVKNLAEEIILVDSGSTDRTIDRARAFTEKIFHRDWTGYSAQKQFALDKAAGPWVLNIDADERVTPTLQNEIREVLQKKTTFEAFDIPFHH